MKLTLWDRTVAGLKLITLLMFFGKEDTKFILDQMHKRLTKRLHAQRIKHIMLKAKLESRSAQQQS
jgi:hypothetical protein